MSENYFVCFILGQISLDEKYNTLIPFCLFIHKFWLNCMFDNAGLRGFCDMNFPCFGLLSHFAF